MRRAFVLALSTLAVPALITCIGAGEVVVLVGAADGGGIDATGGGDATGSSDVSNGMDGAEAGDGADGGDGQSADVVVFDGNDGGPGLVTAKVTTAAGPEPGVTVFFSGADGSLLSSEMTDSQGLATATVPEGAMVTAILGQAGTFNLLTYVGVEPGDVLPFVDTTSAVTPPSFSWQLAALPTSIVPGDDGGTASYYELGGPCSSLDFPGNGTLPYSFNCGWSGPFPVLAVASMVVNGLVTPLDGFVYTKTAGNPSDGGTLSLNLDQPWIAASLVPVNVSHIGDNGPNINQADYADGYALTPPTIGRALDADAGTSSVTFEGFPGFPDFVQTEADFNQGSSRSVLAVRNDTVPTSVSFDGSQALPLILAGGFDAVTHPARPTASWTPVGSLASADGTYVSFELGTLTWTFIVPPAATTLTAPELPAIDGGPALTAGAYLYNALIATVDADGVNGYTAFRQLGTILMPSRSGAQLAPALPKAGQLYRASMITP